MRQAQIAFFALMTLIGIVLVTLPPHSIGSDTLCAFGLALAAVNLGAVLALAEREL